MGINKDEYNRFMMLFEEHNTEKLALKITNATKNEVKFTVVEATSDDPVMSDEDGAELIQEVLDAVNDTEVPQHVIDENKVDEEIMRRHDRAQQDMYNDETWNGSGLR